MRLHHTLATTCATTCPPLAPRATLACAAASACTTRSVLLAPPALPPAPRAPSGLRRLRFRLRHARLVCAPAPRLRHALWSAPPALPLAPRAPSCLRGRLHFRLRHALSVYHDGIRSLVGRSSWIPSHKRVPDFGAYILEGRAGCLPETTGRAKFTASQSLHWLEYGTVIMENLFKRKVVAFPIHSPCHVLPRRPHCLTLHPLPSLAPLAPSPLPLPPLPSPPLPSPLCPRRRRPHRGHPHRGHPHDPALASPACHTLLVSRLTRCGVASSGHYCVQNGLGLAELAGSG